MKKIKWKILIVTCIVTVLPIILGISVYDRLPDRMAIHFDISNTPDNYTTKAFAVFGLPLFMLLLQIMCCVLDDVNSSKKGSIPKVERILKWIIPILTHILYTVTIIYSLGGNPDIRRIACLMVGAIFVVVGNYLPKMKGSVNWGIHPNSGNADTKILRIGGYGYMILGIITILSILLPSGFSVFAIILMLLFSVVYSIYSLVEMRKK